MAGKLTLCGTPIGNLDDMSPRAVKALSVADVIACEDSRRLRKLTTHFSIRPREVIVYNETNERRASRSLLAKIVAGAHVVLVSDAGMPGLSDPGYRLVDACIESDVEIDVVPGPSAVVTALAISGLPPARFVFEGFLPRKQSDRRRRIQELGSEERTIVLFESPHRVAESLSDLSEILGARPAALARELTKLHQEVLRAPLDDLAKQVADRPPKGEIVLVVGGAVRDHKDTPGPEALARAARLLMEEGVARRDAMAEVARSAGVRRRAVFDALLAERSEGEAPEDQ